MGPLVYQINRLDSNEFRTTISNQDGTEILFDSYSINKNRSTFTSSNIVDRMTQSLPDGGDGTQFFNIPKVIGHSGIVAVAIHVNKISKPKLTKPPVRKLPKPKSGGCGCHKSAASLK